MPDSHDSTGASDRDSDLTRDLSCARDGDEAAFGRVYRAVQPGLLRYLSALVGNDAEDVASETWAQACRDLPTFRGDIDGFRGWIARIGRNRAIDQIRAQARRPVAAAGVEALDTHTSLERTDEDCLESISTARAIAMIAALPRDQAEAVLLRSVMGLDARSAGRVLGKRPGAVRSSTCRGLQALARRLSCTPQVSDQAAQISPGDVFDALDADEVR